MSDALIPNELPTVPSDSSPPSLFQSFTQGNPYFSAGFGLMGVGAALTIARRGLVMGSSLVKRRMLVTLEIPIKDPSYLWFLQWMSHRSQSPLARSALAMRSHELAVETTTSSGKHGEDIATKFSLVPGPGTHYFRFKDNWFQVKRERDGKMMDLTSGVPWETVSLTTLSSARNLFPLLLDEARELAMQNQVGKTIIYTAWGPEWRPFGKGQTKRDLGSVVLDQGVQKRISDDLKWFMNNAKWYSERGIPYRRGYLLHGPPGSGKTSFIQALAGSVSYNICVLNLSERGLTDDKLNHLLANAPDKSIVLLEDVDAAFTRRVQTDETGFSSSVTFSGLLNALDGVASSTSQRILFMTTNHPDKLDPALIRPGRVDLKEYLGDATVFQAVQLFRRFYAPDSSDRLQTTPLSAEDLDALAIQIEHAIENGISQGKAVSMAALQGHFIRHAHNATAATLKLSNLIELTSSGVLGRKKMIIDSAPS